jgi:hypothetical protein
VPQRLWRLSNAQYGNAIRDLLSLDAAPSVTGGGETTFSFYSSDNELVSDALAFSYAAAAEGAAARADVTALAACEAGDTEQACAERFIRDFATRAFRRAATESEVADLIGVYLAGAPEGHEGGLRLVIEAVLNAPSLVYRSELGSPVASDRAELTGLELASALSFLLLDSAPDTELWAAAESGALTQPEGLRRELLRLVGLPRVQQNLTEVVLAWFGAAQVTTKSKADPSFDQALKEDLVNETRAFVHDSLWQSAAPLSSLITSNRTFLNQRLAGFYGVDAQGAGPGTWLPFEFPAGTRAGFLTHASIMSSWADVEETSVVLRGKFVRSQVLCMAPLPTPPAFASDPNIVAALAAASTERARAEYRASNPTCAGCHAGLDPLGLTFEHFDPLGRYRSQAHGAPVDASAEFSGDTFGQEVPALSGRVAGAAELGARIAQDPRIFAGCAAQQLTTYALGRPVQRWGRAGEDCELDAIVEAAAQTGQLSVPALVEALVLSPSFRFRRIHGAG